MATYRYMSLSMLIRMSVLFAALISYRHGATFSAWVVFVCGLLWEVARWKK